MVLPKKPVDSSTASGMAKNFVREAVPQALAIAGAKIPVGEGVAADAAAADAEAAAAEAGALDAGAVDAASPTEGDVSPESEPFHNHLKIVHSKLPQEWQTISPNRKGIGFRWQDPNNPGNRVRVDKGNSNNSQPSQQEDHVVVHSNGRIIGRDGKPINGRIKDDPENAHIPLHEYLNWKKWNSPT